jgi:hypothetical protein
LEKKKVDVKLKDVHGLSALHHLAMNNISAQVRESLKSNKFKENVSYFVYRKGKKIKRKNERADRA